MEYFEIVEFSRRAGLDVRDIIHSALDREISLYISTEGGFLSVDRQVLKHVLASKRENWDKVVRKFYNGDKYYIDEEDYDRIMEEIDSGREHDKSEYILVR